MERIEDTRKIELTGTVGTTSRESVAYDYSRFDTRERWTAPPADLKIVRPRNSKRVRISIITPNLVLMVVIFAALCVGVVWSSMILTEKTNQVSDLKHQLGQLKAESTMLQTKQDERFSLAMVESYAVDELGMVKLTGEQLRYIDVSNPDRVEVLDPHVEADKLPLYLEIVEWVGANK